MSSSETKLPAIFTAIHDEQLLHKALIILLEPSPILGPLASQLCRDPQTEIINSYSLLLDKAFELIDMLPVSEKASFISGHPRIGETKNLSALSSKEQASQATPIEVLHQLEQLNRLYEERYPGLRYITFVNGRSRAEIAAEMTQLLDIEGTELETTHLSPVDVDGEEWAGELSRALRDTKAIGQSRLRSLSGF
ncbi:hypothetical protein SISNIDRAFT_484644 [Sistotremastrum niveocremeum HHB9708]|uniref:Oxo-4-hydroxy-4-carboxy-5-ureidoimidazoline decarboxylase domain-containing protein n=2 Tax=Sistotremastraceae TaxID=3402574 RepID=A0A164VSC5_9AGAM|nr:hypothetical protein SISNIDRAFT_484644 [Sistotremastrum niveocremeum HHB9708]KZT43085.1 hypothetical protein SISSUDRAFT_978702 [Sistotremastrum suecicum HHB10207 ss-3]